MKRIPCLTAALGLLAFSLPAFAAESEILSASDIASRLSAQRENMSTDVRLRMEIEQPAGNKTAAYQIQIKERRTASGADVAYVILWPKEQKGEAIVVRQKSGSKATAQRFSPAGDKFEAVALNQPVFGSGLAVADTIENFFAWKNQALVGEEVVDRVPCQILESKPGSGDSSIYDSVRTWVDTRRMVPLRVEKFLPSGKLARRIDTTRVVPQGQYGNLPANLRVQEPGKNAVTDLDGSRIRRDVKFTDRDFSAEGLKQAVPETATGE